MLVYAKTKTDVHANRKPTQDAWIFGGIGRFGFSQGYTARKTDSQVELWIAHCSGQTVKNKASFKGLEAQKTATPSIGSSSHQAIW